MAFTASTCWEVQTGGDDTNNGGGFDTGVAGFPTDGAATAANTSAPVFTSASYTFVAGDVGAWIYIKSGTSWTPGWYKIASVSAGAATLNGTIGAAVLAAGTPTTVVGCATVASPTAATWGIDYSQQAGSQFTFTDMVIDGTTNTKFTSALKPVGKNYIGNIISVTSGTGFTVQRVVIVSTSTITATCDKSLGTLSSTGGNGRLGGALASPGQCGGLKIASNTMWIKSGTYTLSSASANVSGGTVSDTTGAATAGVTAKWEGYGSVRGDLGAAPVILVPASGVSTITIFAVSGATQIVRNITVDGASKTAIRGFSINGGTDILHLCTAQNCTNTGIANTGGTNLFLCCKATGCTTAGTAVGYVSGTGFFFGCEAFANTVPGFGGASGANVSFCLSYANSGVTTDGFATSATFVLQNCVAYGNGRDGFRLTGFGSCFNCLAEGNTGFGFGAAAGTHPITLHSCGGVSNTGGTLDPLFVVTYTFLIGTASFFVLPASGNFALNNTAGGGALARAAGIPGAYPSGLTTGYQDIGAAQSQAVAAQMARVFTGY